MKPASSHYLLIFFSYYIHTYADVRRAFSFLSISYSRATYNTHCTIMLGNQITFWSNVRLDQIAFEVVYEKRKKLRLLYEVKNRP